MKNQLDLNGGQGLGEDLYDITVIAEEIIAYTNQNAAEVWRRLAQELDKTGSNVVAETRRFGVTPHVFDEKMIRFYTESDGFIYETCIESRNPFRMEKWMKIAKFIAQTQKPRSQVKILLYGDSVGNDTIFLKRMGFNVFYHDYDGYCSRFAKMRFKRRNLAIQSFDPKSSGQFDFVVCFEVAEHVPNPPELIAELATLVAPDGYCIFSEAFALIHPQYPTHVASNARFIGKSDELFRQNGMRVAWRDQHDKPIVYTKQPFTVGSALLTLKTSKSARRLKRVLRNMVTVGRT